MIGEMPPVSLEAGTTPAIRLFIDWHNACLQALRRWPVGFQHSVRWKHGRNRPFSFFMNFAFLPLKALKEGLSRLRLKTPAAYPKDKKSPRYVTTVVGRWVKGVTMAMGLYATIRRVGLKLDSEIGPQWRGRAKALSLGNYLALWMQIKIFHCCVTFVPGPAPN